MRQRARTVSWSRHCETLIGTLPLFCASSRSTVPLPASVGRIIAVSIGGLGDTILFSPVLKALKARYPRGRIELLVASPLAQEAFSGAEEIDSIRCIGTHHPRYARRFVELIRYARQCRRHGGADMAVFATGLNPRMALLLKSVAGIRMVCRAPQIPTCDTDLACNLKLAHRFDPTVRGSDAFVPVSKEAVRQAKHMLNRADIDPERDCLMALYPSTGLPHRPRWPLNAFREATQVLQQRVADLKCIVLGSAAEGLEWSRCDTMGSANAVFAGRAPIAVTAALLAHCSMVLGSDGGLIHVAGAVGCPLVVVMTTTPINYRPPGEHTFVIRGDGSRNSTIVPAAPGEVPSVEEIVDACLDLLAAAPKPSQG